jgi:NAD(P)-dependent dehydrogenase (short-subunit alcohol dehydrogenase family)
MNGLKLRGRVLAVDLSSAFYLARAVVPAMKERRRGSIIAIGGQSSVTSRANTAAVTAAKTGLLGLVRALAAELGPFGIRANMVMPGFIDTERRYASGIRSSASRHRVRRTSSRRSPSAGSAVPRTSPTPACSSPPTRRRTSPATLFASWAAASSADALGNQDANAISDPSTL